MEKIDLRANEFLEKFVSQDHVDSNDVQFWYHLLSRSFNFMRVSNPKMVDKTLEPYIVRLTLNNSQSLNIGSLIRVFLDRVSRIKTADNQSTNPYYVFQSFNALYLLRTITKSYVENVSEDQLIKALRAYSDKTDVTPGSVMLTSYISSLIAIIVDIPIDDSTYLLIVESINALLVLLSVQMYSNVSANQLAIYKCIMQKKCSIHALMLTKTLLNNFVNQRVAPEESGSIIIGLASGLWNILTLGYGQSPDICEEESMPPLAKQSLLLLNILTNHCTSGDSNSKNPYREAIMHCQDTSFSLSDPNKSFIDAENEAMVTATTSRSVLISNSIKIDFQRLYETICNHLDDDQVSLLLYMLLQSNPIFRPYILTTASKDLDKLLLPLLKILYSSIERGSHHVYMVLIIFIILSEESSFNDAIQKITLRNIVWFKDRILSEISLASFTTLIIIRSFQYNTFRIKDKFLHTNLFATLANLSNHFDQLHPYVCQRLVDFLERLGKRYFLMTKSNSQPTGNEFILPQQDLNQISFPHRQHSNASLDSSLARALSNDVEQQDASSLELDSSTPTTSTIIQPTGGVVNIAMQDVPAPSSETTNQIDPVVVDTTISSAVSLDQADQSNGLSPTGSSSTTATTNNNNEQTRISMEDNSQDFNTLAEIIRMVLEVINNVLVVRLKDNPNLIYTLLYKRNVFSNLLASHPTFYNLVINVERILTYTYNQIEAYGRPLSVEEIKALIGDICNNWNFKPDRDSHVRLLFHYVEDEQPEEFFIPYIWTRVYYSSMISWDSKRIVLFNPDEM